jgi:BolA protein
MKQRIEEKLKNNLNPIFLEVINNSHLHSGHMGDNGTGETHFLVKIFSEKLKDLSLVNAHRRVNAILKDELGVGGIHALEIKIVK